MDREESKVIELEIELETRESQNSISSEEEKHKEKLTEENHKERSFNLKDNVVIYDSNANDRKGAISTYHYLYKEIGEKEQKCLDYQLPLGSWAFVFFSLVICPLIAITIAATSKRVLYEPIAADWSDVHTKWYFWVGVLNQILADTSMVYVCFYAMWLAYQSYGDWRIQLVWSFLRLLNRFLFSAFYMDPDELERIPKVGIQHIIILPWHKFCVCFSIFLFLPLLVVRTFRVPKLPIFLKINVGFYSFACFSFLTYMLAPLADYLGQESLVSLFALIPVVLFILVDIGYMCVISYFVIRESARKTDMFIDNGFIMTLVTGLGLGWISMSLGITLIRLAVGSTGDSGDFSLIPVILSLVFSLYMAWFIFNFASVARLSLPLRYESIVRYIAEFMENFIGALFFTSATYRTYSFILLIIYSIVHDTMRDTGLTSYLFHMAKNFVLRREAKPMSELDLMIDLKQRRLKFFQTVYVEICSVVIVPLIYTLHAYLDYKQIGQCTLYLRNSGGCTQDLVNGRYETKFRFDNGGIQELIITFVILFVAHLVSSTVSWFIIKYRENQASKRIEALSVDERSTISIALQSKMMQLPPANVYFRQHALYFAATIFVLCENFV